MNYLESVITRLKKHVNRILPAGAVTAVLGASLIVGTTGIIGLGTGYSYGGPNCLSANITAGPAYPQLPGTMVTLTATATNCTHPEFQFYVQVPGGLWTAKTSFLPWGQNTYSWDTTGLSAGNYGVGVWARHSGSAGSYEAYYIGTYQLAVSNCQTASLTASPAAPQSPATNITFTADSCPGAQFMFWMLSPGASGWTSLSLYGGNTFLWITGPGQPQGTYQFGVWARQPGSTAAYDAYQIITYQLVFPPCKAATIAPNVASPQANGTSVTFTAQCTSVGSGETFQFWEYPPGGTWTIKQAYSPTNTFTETVTVVGPHYFGVWIKGPFSTNSYDVYAIITFEAGP